LFNTLRPPGVHSEVGRLDCVIVAAPGLAHRRLTPSNCDKLLFDDVFWVERATQDHHEFVGLMRDRGIRVLDVSDLLTDTLRTEKGRSWVIDHVLSTDRLGVGPVAEIQGWIRELGACCPSLVTRTVWYCLHCPIFCSLEIQAPGFTKMLWTARCIGQPDESKAY